MRFALLLAVVLTASPALAREFETHVVMGHYGFQSDYPQIVEFMLWPSRNLVATFQTGDDFVGVTQRVDISPDNPLNIFAVAEERPRFAWSVFGDGLIETDYTGRNLVAGRLPATVHFDYVYSESYPAQVDHFTAVSFELYGIFDRGDHYESSFFVRVHGVLVPEPTSAALLLFGLCYVGLHRRRGAFSLNSSGLSQQPNAQYVS